MVVTVPTGSDVAYTQYAEISLDENIDLIVSEGDDFVTDILGLSTSGISTQTGIGGRIRAGTFTNKAGTGAPQLTFGAEIPVGYGLTGAGGINVGGAATISGNLTVGGVLTYDDVTNVDSLGIVTARGGFEVGASGVGGTITATGQAEFVGVVTASSFVGSGSGLTGIAATNNINTSTLAQFTGGVGIADSIFHIGDDNTAIRFPAADTFTVETAGSERYRITSGISLFKSGLAEKVNVKSQLTSANTCAITDGNVILTTSAEPGNTYPDITGVHSVLSSGEGFSVTIALKVDGSGTINGFRIDGVAQTIEWSGGSAPSAGSDGYDVFTFSAFKTGSGTTDYKVFGAATNYT
jgi:hypothetical protein